MIINLLKNTCSMQLFMLVKLHFIYFHVRSLLKIKNKKSNSTQKFEGGSSVSEVIRIRAKRPEFHYRQGQGLFLFVTAFWLALWHIQPIQ